MPRNEENHEYAKSSVEKGYSRLDHNFRMVMQEKSGDSADWSRR